MSKDTEVNSEDQQKINQFARCNAQFNELKADIAANQTELENMAFAEDEMLVCLEEDEKVPYMFDELFIMKTQDEATESLAADKGRIEIELSGLREQASTLESTMSGLRSALYSKFGNNIRLEHSDDES